MSNIGMRGATARIKRDVLAVLAMLAGACADAGTESTDALVEPAECGTLPAMREPGWAKWTTFHPGSLGAWPERTHCPVYNRAGQITSDPTICAQGSPVIQIIEQGLPVHEGNLLWVGTRLRNVVKETSPPIVEPEKTGIVDNYIAEFIVTLPLESIEYDGALSITIDAVPTSQLACDNANRESSCPGSRPLSEPDNGVLEEGYDPGEHSGDYSLVCLNVSTNGGATGTVWNATGTMWNHIQTTEQGTIWPQQGVYPAYSEHLPNVRVDVNAPTSAAFVFRGEQLQNLGKAAEKSGNDSVRCYVRSGLSHPANDPSARTQDLLLLDPGSIGFGVTVGPTLTGSSFSEVFAGELPCGVEKWFEFTAAERMILAIHPFDGLEEPFNSQLELFSGDRNSPPTTEFGSEGDLPFFLDRGSSILLRASLEATDTNGFYSFKVVPGRIVSEELGLGGYGAFVEDSLEDGESVEKWFLLEDLGKNVDGTLLTLDVIGDVTASLYLPGTGEREYRTIEATEEDRIGTQDGVRANMGPDVTSNGSGYSDFFVRVTPSSAGLDMNGQTVLSWPFSLSVDPFLPTPNQQRDCQRCQP